MIGLDANVLLRYFTQDDDIQSAVATRLLDRRLTPQRPGYISLPAILELVWTLRKSYSLSPEAISGFLETLAVSSHLVIQNQQEVLYAASAMEAGFGFADALTAALGTAAGCAKSVTFDRKASRLPGFELL